jgi:hypothetical protein
MSGPASDGGAFSRRGAAWLAALAVGSLAAAGFLGAFGDALYDPPSFSQDTFSRSAVGHRAFAELLRALGFRVIVSRHRTAEKAQGEAVVALLEPRLGPDDEAGEGRFEGIDDAATALLVVLPKREAIPDPVRPRTVASADLLSPDVPRRVLEKLDADATIARPERSASAWRGELPLPTLDAPQLVVSKRLRPLVENDDGILVGELEQVEAEEAEEDEEGQVSPGNAGPQSLEPPPRWRTIVVADPDLLATHGLGRGENALLLVRILERLGAGDRAVVIDETMHGLEQQPSLALELVRFPLVLATVSALLVGGLLAWGALVRFGRPRPPEPPLKPGRLALVESTAGLLRHGGHFAHAAAAYLRAAKQRVTAQHRAGGEGSEDEAWLARIVEARGKGAELRALEERVQRLAARRVRGEEEAVRTAQAIHGWREEMTDGADADSRRHRAAQG